MTLKMTPAEFTYDARDSGDTGDALEGQSVSGEIYDACELAGVSPELLGRDVLGRLELAREFDGHEQGERGVMLACMRMAAHLVSEPLEGQPELKSPDLFVSRAGVGALLHDIGKNGPPHATPQQQKSFLLLYSFAGIPDFRTLSVRNFLDRTASGGHQGRVLDRQEADLVLRHFDELGISSDMTLEQFYILHSTWTYEVIRPVFTGEDSAVLNPKTADAVAAHHLYRGVNPSGNPALSAENIIRQGGQYPPQQYELMALQRLYMVMDVYDAFSSRGNRDRGNEPLTHAQAVSLTRSAIGPVLCADILVARLLDEVDRYGMSLFKKEKYLQQSA